MKYNCTVKNNKTDDETNQIQQRVKPRPKGAETDACVRFLRHGAISDHISHPHFFLISIKPTVASAGSVNGITSCTGGMFPEETSVTRGSERSSGTDVLSRRNLLCVS